MGTKTSLEAWLERSRSVVGIVHADIVDSTLLLHRLKTRNFALVLRAYESRAATLATHLEGRLVDRVGDQLLAAFATAGAAYQFASELFRDPGDAKLVIRVGVHFGRVKADDAQLVGRHVHIGARVMELGRGHELWVSDAAKTALERESLSLAASIEWITSQECELQGVPDKHRVWRAA